MVWSRCQRIVKSEQFGIWLARRRVLEVRMTAPMMILELFWRNEWLRKYMSIYVKGHVTRSKDKKIYDTFYVRLLPVHRSFVYTWKRTDGVKRETYHTSGIMGCYTKRAKGNSQPI